MSGNIKHSGSGPQVPVILSVHRAKADLVAQNYENLVIVTSKEGTAQEFFNKTIREYNVDGIYGFLSEFDYLMGDDAISEVVNAISNQYVGAVYSDSLLLADNYQPQMYPPFSAESYEGIVVNTPLFMVRSVLQQWNTELQTAYFYDYFKRIANRTLVAHIPKALIATKKHPVSIKEIQEVCLKPVEM